MVFEKIFASLGERSIRHGTPRRVNVSIPVNKQVLSWIWSRSCRELNGLSSFLAHNLITSYVDGSSNSSIFLVAKSWLKFSWRLSESRVEQFCKLKSAESNGCYETRFVYEMCAWITENGVDRFGFQQAFAKGCETFRILGKNVIKSNRARGERLNGFYPRRTSCKF